MLKYKNEFSIAAMCRVLVVSRSGFYDWLVKQDKPRLLKHRQQQIDAHIAHAFNADKGRSGAIRVMLALDKKGIHYNRKTVALSLQRQGLRAKAARKFKATTQSKHNLPVADNLLKQDFTASQPNQKWAGDITYLWTNEGWYYLAVVLDLYSRKVIGWAMSERMTARLVCDALTMVRISAIAIACFGIIRSLLFLTYSFTLTDRNPLFFSLIHPLIRSDGCCEPIDPVTHPLPLDFRSCCTIH